MHATHFFGKYSDFYAYSAAAAKHARRIAYGGFQTKRIFSTLLNTPTYTSTPLLRQKMQVPCPNIYYPVQNGTAL
jgi:hypothetical protein